MIYFVRLGEGGPIKIGCTHDIPWRMERLRNGHKLRVQFLKTVPGEREQEREAHERFAHYRIGRSEQFRPGPDLMDYLGLARIRDWESVQRAKETPRVSKVVSIPMDAEHIDAAMAYGRKHCVNTLAGSIKLMIRHCNPNRNYKDAVRRNREGREKSEQAP